MGARHPALDWMRGLVILLMAVDHASEVFNAGRMMADSAHMYRPGMDLPLDQFLTRWITHLCAPTFVFLAGAGLALSFARRSAAGDPPRALDRYLLVRGLLIAVLDPIWMSHAFVPGRVLLQVLYAIGVGLLFMIPLRRLGQAPLLAIGLGLLVFGEALADLARGEGRPGIAAGLLLTGGRFGPVIVGYPLLHWLAVMILGWVFGRWLQARRPARPERLLLVTGATALAVFALVRGLNGYGNMHLLREGGSLVQWLHVSKYPPSLSFQALELGIMAFLLAGLFVLQRSRARGWRGLDLLLVPGQTAFFFYLLHVHLLHAVAWLVGGHGRFGVESAFLGAAGVALVLFPACLWYRAYKARHPTGWARYI